MGNRVSEIIKRIAEAKVFTKTQLEGENGRSYGQVPAQKRLGKVPSTSSYERNTPRKSRIDDHQIYHTGRKQSSVTSKLTNSARTATNCKCYDSNLLPGNLKKYQTMNIGYIV